MKILLISSNPDAKVPNEGYDLYVHFTSAVHWGKTPWDKSAIAVRKFIKVERANSFRFKREHKEAKTVYAVG